MDHLSQYSKEHFIFKNDHSLKKLPTDLKSAYSHYESH